MAEKKNGIVVDTSYFTTIGRISEFQESARRLKDYIEFITKHKLVASWGFPGDPHKSEDIADLPIEQWKLVDKTVTDAVSAVFQESNTGDFKGNA